MQQKKIIPLVCLLSPAVFSQDLNIPTGFEELAKGQEVLTEIVVYGQSLGLHKAWIDLETVKFTQPEKLEDALQNIYPDASSLKKEFTKKFHRNGNLSCSSNGNSPGCDYLETNDVALIYDENNSKILLFINKKISKNKQNEMQSIFYRQSLESRNALIHQQNINFVSDKNYQAASIQGNGTLGLTENGYINIDWAWFGQKNKLANTQQSNINNMYIRQDILSKYYIQFGDMDERDIFSNAGGNINLSQLPIGKVRGIRLGSTLAWVNMDKVSTGTPVSLFLPRDSRVDAYRGKQLLATFYLKTGLQELDTKPFPMGSYTVTLKIYEDNQLVRTESVLYTGLSNASSGGGQWFLQGGEVNNDYYKSSNKEEHDKRAFQAGVRLPLTESLSLTGGVSVFNTSRFFENAIDWTHGFDSSIIDGNLTTRVSYLHGNEGSRGNIQQFNYNDGFSLSFYRTVMTAEQCDGRRKASYSITGCYKNTNVQFAVPINRWYGTLGYSMNSNESRYVSDWQQNYVNSDINKHTWEDIYKTRIKSRTWQVGINKTTSFSGIDINASINAYIRKDSGLQGNDKGGFVSFTIFKSHNTDTERSSSSIGMNWQRSNGNGNLIDYNADYHVYSGVNGEDEKGISLSGIDSNSVTTSMYGRMGGAYGNSMLTLNDTWNRNGNRHSLSASGNYNSSLIIDEQGLSLGKWGGGTPSAAVTIDVEQDDVSSQGKIGVSLDNGSGGDVRANKRALFTVPGYRETNFSITDSTNQQDGISNEFISGSGARKVFMIPGKVFSRNVKVSTRYTWLGKFIDERKNPLSDVIPLNVMQWSPLGNGNFTMETEKKLKSLFLMGGDKFWHCQINVRTIKDVVRYVGTTECQNVDFSSLPVEEKNQFNLIAGNKNNYNNQTVMSK